jgi:diguanylate cyclase
MPTKRLTAKLSALNSIVLNAFNLSNEKDIVAEFIKAGMKVLDADFGYSFIKATNSSKFSLLYITPGVDYFPNPIPRKQGIVARAYSTRQPQLISDVPQTDFVRHDARSAMQSVAVVPITYKNNTYGTLHFAYYKTHKFTEEEQNLFTYIGNSAAQAITINRLYNDLRGFKNTLDNTLDSIFIFDSLEARLLYVNKGAVKLSGYKRSEILQKTFLDMVVEPSRKEIAERIEAIESGTGPKHFEFQTFLKCSDESKVPIEISMQLINQLGRPEHYLAVVRDITQRREAEISITKMAYFDQLTGIPNRVMLNEKVKEEHIRAQGTNGMYALFFLDLDRFKIINDIYGHYVGDMMLKQVAQRVSRAIPKKAMVARMGGDEFLVLLPNIKSVAEAELCAINIQETFAELFKINEHELYSNGSVGFAIFPLNGADYHVVMKHADLALHRAKDHGGGNVQHYNDGHANFLTMQPMLHSQLRHAIKRNELTLEYQPVVNVQTKKIIGSEALIRWNHPERGLLYPRDFISQAEESGLIVEIGQWVINEVCRQIREWETEGRIPPPVSINVSPRELLRPALVDTISASLKKYRISPSQIKLELTETFLMKNIDLSISILEQLKSIGLGILIDDFGTGYASLNYLRRLPIDAVKIDQSFVAGIPVNIQDAALTSAIIAISHQLGLDVVAEGVEELSQLEFLEDSHCNFVQGNYFYMPLSPKDFAELF